MTAPAGPALAAVQAPSRAASAARFAPYALAAYCAVLFFWNLGAAPLTDVDEGAFSEATREMLARGDFVTTYLNGDLRFDKPILTYWLQAIPVALAGPVEWAFRLPSAIAASLWAYLLYRFARRHARDAAIAAPFMLASSLGPLVIARSATADALLNAFVAGALFAFYRHLTQPRRADLVAAFAWTGLGVLTKGPIAIAVPALAVALYCASRREWLRPFALLREPLAWLVFAAIVVPWYALELHAQGDAFVAGFFLKHNVDRFTGTMLHHGGNVLYYVGALPLLVFPFLAPLAGALARVREARDDDLQRFLWCTFAGVFAFFSLSRTQLPHYLLYGMTPLYLLLATHRRRFSGVLAIAAPACVGLAVVAALPAIAGALVPRARGAFERLMLADLASSLQRLTLEAAVAIALVVVAIVLVQRLPAHARADARLYAAAGIPALFMVLVLWPQAIAWFQAPVAAAGEAMRGNPATIVEWNANWPSFSVYRRAPTPARRPTPGEIVLTRSDRADELPPHDVVFARREVLLARVRSGASQ